MPIIKIWCLPKSTEEELNRLHKAMVRAIVGISELELQDEKDMTMFFPPDMMSYGLGTEIIVEISIFNKPNRTKEVRQRLAKVVGECVTSLYPNAKVECEIRIHNPEEGFWTSANAEPRTQRQKMVFIAHPMSGDIERNSQMVAAICRTIHMQGIIPVFPSFTWRNYLTDSEDDKKLAEMINEEYFSRGVVDEVWFFGEKFSAGMEKEARLAMKYGIPVVGKTSVTVEALSKLQ